MATRFANLILDTGTVAPISELDIIGGNAFDALLERHY
jgi:hypothetical protein